MTDDDGRVALAQLPPGCTFQVTLSEPGSEPGAFWRWGPGVLVQCVLGPGDLGLPFTPGEERELSFELPARHEDVGRLLDHRGRAVSKEQVLIVRAGGDSARSILSGVDVGLAEAHTDKEGRFRFTGVSAGRWMVGVSPETRRFYDSTATAVEVADGLAPLELVTHRNLRIRGQVLGPDGAPIAGARVSANPHGVSGSVGTWSDAEGAFVLRRLAPGAHRIEASASAVGTELLGTGSVEAQTGDHSVTVELPRAALLTGWLDPAPGPLERTRLRLIRRDRPGGTLTGCSDGSFSFERHEPGTYDLIATTGAGRIGIARGLELRAGEVLADVVVPMEAGGYVLSVVRGSRESVRIELLREGLELCNRFESWLTPGVPKTWVAPVGALKVRVLGAEDELLEQRELVVRAGETTEVILGE